MLAGRLMPSLNPALYVFIPRWECDEQGAHGADEVRPWAPKKNTGVKIATTVVSQAVRATISGSNSRAQQGFCSRPRFRRQHLGARRVPPGMVEPRRGRVRGPCALCALRSQRRPDYVQCMCQEPADGELAMLVRSGVLGAGCSPALYVGGSFTWPRAQQTISNRILHDLSADTVAQARLSECGPEWVRERAVCVGKSAAEVLWRTWRAW